MECALSLLLERIQEMPLIKGPCIKPTGGNARIGTMSIEKGPLRPEFGRARSLFVYTDLMGKIYLRDESQKEDLHSIKKKKKEDLQIEMRRLRQIKGRLRQIEGRLRKIEMMRLRQIEEKLRRKGVYLGLRQIEVDRERLLQIEMRCTTNQPLKTEVYYCPWTRKRDPDCYPSNRIIDIITQASTVVIIVANDVQGGSSGPMKVAKGLTKKKTHKGAKGGRGRERSISGGRDGKAIRDINWDPDPAPHIQKTGRPQVGFPFSQANGGVEGRDESRDGLERESGSESTCGGRDQERGKSGGSEYRDEGEGSGSIESRGQGGEGSGFGSECRDVKGEGSGSVESECRDAEGGEGSRSGANQDQDGEGEGSSSGESQGQDRGEGSASGENQGGDRNAEGSGSSDDEDERECQRRVRGDIEHGRQENNQEEIDFSSIPETFMAISSAEIIAAVTFHSSGAISSTILSLVTAINGFGFFCCMTSMLHRHRNPRAARIFGTIGGATSGLGLLLLVSVPFPSYYAWMILGVGSLVIVVISVLAFMP